jgi:hypothetical protein
MNEIERLEMAIGEEEDRIAAEKASAAAMAFGCVLLRSVDKYEVTCVARDTYQMPFHGMMLMYDTYYDKLYVRYRAPFLWTKKICTFSVYLRQSRIGAEELLHLLKSYGKYNIA